MRLALMVTSLTASLGTLAACGGQPENAGPERRSAAGEVLGGEVSDDMLPLDTVRSTAPADPRAGAPRGGATPAGSGRPAPPPIPAAEVSGGPEPHTPPSPGVEPTDGPVPQ